MRNHLPRGSIAVILALLLALAPIAPAVGAAGAASTSSSDTQKFGEAVQQYSTWRGFEGGDDVLTHGVDGYPGWIIGYEANKSNSLHEWVNASEERTLRAHDNSSRWMLISAPAEHVGVSGRYQEVGRHLSGFPGVDSRLSSRSYVEFIEVNRKLSIPEPISNLESSSAWEKPSYSGWATFGGLQGTHSADGQAWSGDVNESTIRDAKNVSGAAGTGYTGNGVRVATVDNGFTYSADLHDSRVVAGYNVFSNESLNASKSYQNRNYSILEGGAHGSWVASSIAANHSNDKWDGVAPDASLVPVKALGDDGSGSVESVATGLEWACTAGNADIVSMSLGSEFSSEVINREIESCLKDEGVKAIVVANGNSKQVFTPGSRWLSSPADHPDTIAVGATSVERPGAARPAYFSSVGPDPAAEHREPTVGIPGMSITVMIERGAGLEESTLSGTSMATPIEAGHIALLLEKEPDLDYLQVQQRVERTASPMQHAAASEVGHGMGNATNLLSDTAPEQSQEAAMSDKAASRDGADRALSGSWLAQTAQAAGL